VQPGDAVILLRHWGWNKDRLFERYMENAERCAIEAGIEGSGRQPRLKRVRGFVCQVCFETSSTTETIALTCDHRYCRDCYTHYLEQKIGCARTRRMQVYTLT
jgi:ariadne-1